MNLQRFCHIENQSNWNRSKGKKTTCATGWTH
jgi:hypothetical protein